MRHGQELCEAARAPRAKAYVRQERQYRAALMRVAGAVLRGAMTVAKARLKPHGEDRGGVGPGYVGNDGFAVTLSRVQRCGCRVVLKGQGPVGAHWAEQVAQEGESIVECGVGGRGPTGLACPGQAQGQSSSSPEVVAVGQEHVLWVGEGGGVGEWGGATWVRGTPPRPQGPQKGKRGAG
jgi:hypothetical protein